MKGIGAHYSCLTRLLALSRPVRLSLHGQEQGTGSIKVYRFLSQAGMASMDLRSLTGGACDADLRLGKHA